MWMPSIAIRNIARFNNPYGIAVDHNGNVYVADSANSTVRKLTLVGTNWVTATIAGLPGTPGSDDGTNGEARFQYPQGIAVDRDGNVYIGDVGNATIRRLVRVGTNWVTSTIASVGSPNGLAVDTVGNIFVAASDTICELTPQGTNWVLTTIAGIQGVQGSANGTNSAIQLDNPKTLTLDSAGNIYIANYGDNTIRRLSPVGADWVASTIAGIPGSCGKSPSVVNPN